MVKKSFFKKNRILLFIIIIAFLISGVKTIGKEVKYQDLKAEEEKYLNKISDLESILDKKEKELQEVDTLEFIEKYAREHLRMVKPDEFYYIIHNDD